MNKGKRIHNIPTRRTRTSSSHPYSSTRLYGIRGFRSWFESQFPKAMTTIHHPPPATSSNNKYNRNKNNDSNNTAAANNSKNKNSKQKKNQSQSNTNSNNNNNNTNEITKTETFHHILIDINQLLHITLRRSRTEGHALTLLIQELDKCTTEISIPTKSVVLAFDGPPASAKLATQRRRRYGTIVQAERKRSRLRRLKDRGLLFLNHPHDIDDNDDNVVNEEGNEIENGPNSSRGSLSSQEIIANGGKNETIFSTTTSTNTNSTYSSSSSNKRRKRQQRKSKPSPKRLSKTERDEATLAITPGTAFMEKAHDAVLYWAWQRLTNPKSRLAKCRVYISPSTVPGEGEVKLLDWLVQAGQGSNEGTYGNYNNNDGGRGRPSERKRKRRRLEEYSVVDGEKFGDTIMDGKNKIGNFEMLQTSSRKNKNKNGSNQPNDNNNYDGRIVKPGESVAIMGGDADLVLEGLVISPSITHNVFVILPAGKRMSYAVSLWETTKTLGRFLGPHLDPSDIMRVRTDLVLLLIMNGNDYLPKLRGSSGFNKLFHAYLRLLKEWLKEEQRYVKSHQQQNENGERAFKKETDKGKSEEEGDIGGLKKKHRKRKSDDKTTSSSVSFGNNPPPRPFLVDPDTLEFNIPFCIAFFQKMASFAPKQLAQPSEMIPYHKSITPLSHLYSMVDAGFLPKPAQFVRIPLDDDQNNSNDTNSTTPATAVTTAPSSSSESSETASKNEQSDDTFNPNKSDEKREVLRLTLGDINRKNKNNIGNDSSDQDMLTRCFEFEILHRVGRPLKKTKQLLANMALEDILGKDYMDLNDYFLGNVLDDENDEEDGELDDDSDDSDDLSDGSDKEEGEILGAGYSWEIGVPAESRVDEYLKGLLWNLATYQDGVCANYGYNYGRRMSPTAEEIVSFLQEEQLCSRRLGQKELLNDDFVPPLNAGLTCLAALPAQVQHLVPEPYRWLSEDGTVEDIYASCMDPKANVFDIDSFQRLCLERVRNLERTRDSKDDGEQVVNGDQNGQNQRNQKESMKESMKKSRGRKIRMGETFWTVLQKSNKPIQNPFAPPEPFSERLSNLRSSNRIKATHIHATSKPRWLQTGRGNGDQMNNRQSDMGRLINNALGEKNTLEDIGYRKAYQRTEGGSRGVTGGGGAIRKKEKIEKLKGNEVELESMLKQKNEEKPFKKNDENVDEIFDRQNENTEGQNAMQCLQYLLDSRVLSLVEWEENNLTQYSNETSTDADDNYKTLKLRIKGSEQKAAAEKGQVMKNGLNISVERVRDQRLVSRKLMKQHIAGLAIEHLLGDVDWTKMSFKEMKTQLLPMEDQHIMNIEGNNALQCLNQLQDQKMLTLSWEFITDNDRDTNEIVQLTGQGHEKLRKGEFDFLLKEIRDDSSWSRSAMKHRMATNVIHKIVGDENDWTKMAVKEMKQHMETFTVNSTQ